MTSRSTARSSCRLEIDLRVQPDHFRSDVERELLDVLIIGTCRMARQGLFHPDLSGVSGSRCTWKCAGLPIRSRGGVRGGAHFSGRLCRRVRLDGGRLDMAALEIARLDNDRNFPEHGLVDHHPGEEMPRPSERMRLLRQSWLPLPACFRQSTGSFGDRYRVGTCRRFVREFPRASVDGRWPVLRGLEHATTMISPSRCSTPGPSPATSSRFTRAYRQRIPSADGHGAASILEQSRLLGYRLVQVWLRPRIWPSRWKTIPAAGNRRRRRSLWRSGPRCRQFPGRMSNRKPSRRLRPSKARPAWNALLAQQTATQPLSWNMPVWLVAVGSNVGPTVGRW